MEIGILQTVTVLTIFCAVVVGLKIPLREDFVQEEAYVSISHGEEDYLRRERRDSADFPASTYFVVRTEKGETVSLLLRRCINVDMNIPVYTTIDEKVQKVDLDSLQNVALYRDTLNGASILLERNHGGMNNNNYSAFGTFHSPRGRFVIQPNTFGGHVVSRVPEQNVVFEIETIKGYTAQEQFPRNSSSGHRFRRQSQNNIVEVLIVVDYELYNFWYQMTSGSNRQSQAFQMIRQYMAYVLNEMDMRYENIGRSDYTIGVWGSGIYIADTPSKASWSTNNVFNGNKLQSSSTLDAFRTWTNNQILPPNDHIMGFTGYDLVSSTGDGSGIAYTSAVCSSSSRSLVEDRLTFISMTTATHELGHSLGAGHDGDNNFCSSSDNYVMAITNSVTNDPVGANLWIFSTCSKNAFKSYIDGLSNNCMLSQTANSAPATVDTPMAELYPPDMTCEYALGAGSYVCRSLQDYSTLCISMFCNEPGTTQCYTILPAEGTPCGKGKWCQSGQCVTSSQVPSNVEDDCPIGDQPNPVEGYNQTCAQIVANNPGECYNSYIRLRCCQSCHDAETGVTGCEYGDKNVASCAAMSRFGCYSNENFCCAKCATIKNTQNPGCEFGDKLSGCSASNCPFYNAESREGCCETCFDGTTVSTTSSTSTTSTTSSSTTTTSTTTTTTSSTTTTTTTTTTPKPTTTSKSTKTTTTTSSTSPTTTTSTTLTSTETTPTQTPTTSVTMSTNVSSTVTPAEEPVSDLIMIVAGVVGGVILLIVVIVVVCIVIRKRGKKEKSGSNGTYDNIGFVENRPHHPPPRRDNNSVRAKPPPLKPIKPVYPLKKGRSEMDGYMMPSSPEVQTVSNGVMYTAPDKSAMKLANPLLRQVTEGSNATDQQKRHSKTIHYKRPSGVVDDKKGNNYDSFNQDRQRKQSIDAYDSIGHVEPNAVTGNAHVPTPYHKPYNVQTPALPDRPSDKLRNKPDLPSKRPLKPILPPGVHGRNVDRGEDNSAFTNEDQTRTHNDGNSSRKFPLPPPKPLPRSKLDKNKFNNKTNTDSEQSDTYDNADGVDASRIPMKPPNKPVPRRQNRDILDSTAMDNVGFDSDDTEIQI